MGQLPHSAAVVLPGKLDGICTEILAIIYAGLPVRKGRPFRTRKEEQFYREGLALGGPKLWEGTKQVHSHKPDYNPLSLGRLLTAIRTAAAAAQPPFQG